MAAVSLTVSTVKPLGDRIFIKVSESEEKTAGASFCLIQLKKNHRLEKLLRWVLANLMTMVLDKLQK